MRSVFTSVLLDKIARHVPDAKPVTHWSMATGSVGTINYRGNLYEVRITPHDQGIEKWSHPKKEKSK